MHHRMRFIIELLADARLSGRATFRNVRVNDGSALCMHRARIQHPKAPFAG
jgi:hypothetical protein